MNNIDLRKEIIDMISEYGLDMLYIRDSKYINCKCYNPLYKTGDSKCPICLGFGKLTIIQKIKAIYDNNYFSSGSVTNNGVGLTYKDSVTLYTDNTIIPKPGDKVYIVGWNKSNVPDDVHRVYIIDNIDEVRLDNGRVEGYVVNLKLRTDLLIAAQKSFSQLSRVARLTLSVGGKYIWPYNSKM